jgi:hypothetical protein
MSRFVFSTPIFRWMLDFTPAPSLQFVSIKNRFVQTALSPYFQLALVGFLVVQSMCIRLQESGFD